MAVFMSPRTNYVLGRFEAHSTLSLLSVLSMLLIVGSLVWKPLAPTSLTLFGLTGGALVTKRGRAVVGRTAKETFYGTLGNVTGVCSTEGDGYIGGGGGSVEGD